MYSTTILSPIGIIPNNNKVNPLMSPISPLSPLCTLSSDPFIPPFPVPFLKPTTAKSINTNYSYPLFSFDNSYEDDERIIKRVTKYFYYYVLDKWLKDELVEITYHISEKGETSKEGKFKNNNENVVATKIKYIEDNIFYKDDMEDMLDELTEEAKISWYDLISKHKRRVKKVVKYHLTKLILNRSNDNNKS